MLGQERTLCFSKRHILRSASLSGEWVVQSMAKQWKRKLGAFASWIVRTKPQRFA